MSSIYYHLIEATYKIIKIVRVKKIYNLQILLLLLLFSITH